MNLSRETIALMLPTKVITSNLKYTKSNQTKLVYTIAATTQHKRVLIIFLLILQAIVTAQVMSIGGRGNKQRKHLQPVTDRRHNSRLNVVLRQEQPVARHVLKYARNTGKFTSSSAMAERPRDACIYNTVFASFYVEGIAGGNVSSRRF